jgi:hypothetical protein
MPNERHHEFVGFVVVAPKQARIFEPGDIVQSLSSSGICPLALFQKAAAIAGLLHLLAPPAFAQQDPAVRGGLQNTAGYLEYRGIPIPHPPLMSPNPTTGATVDPNEQALFIEGINRAGQLESTCDTCAGRTGRLAGRVAGLVPAIPIIGHACHPDRDRRDKPGDDATSFAPVTVPTRKCMFLIYKTWLGRQDSNLGMAESKSAPPHHLVMAANDRKAWYGSLPQLSARRCAR